MRHDGYAHPAGAKTDCLVAAAPYLRCLHCLRYGMGVADVLEKILTGPMEDRHRTQRLAWPKLGRLLPVSRDIVQQMRDLPTNLQNWCRRSC